jgi:hypothetical protein
MELANVDTSTNGWADSSAGDIYESVLKLKRIYLYTLCL